MEIYKTLLTFAEEEGKYYKIDTIYYAENWWLVATWIRQVGENKKMPEGLVLMDGKSVRFQEIFEADYRFLVLDPIPSALFRGVEIDGYTIDVHQNEVTDLSRSESAQIIQKP